MRAGRIAVWMLALAVGGSAFAADPPKEETPRVRVETRPKVTRPATSERKQGVQEQPAGEPKDFDPRPTDGRGGHLGYTPGITPENRFEPGTGSGAVWPPVYNNNYFIPPPGYYGYTQSIPGGYLPINVSYGWGYTGPISPRPRDLGPGNPFSIRLYRNVPYIGLNSPSGAFRRR